jgi:hypothetical protein
MSDFNRLNGKAISATNLFGVTYSAAVCSASSQHSNKKNAASERQLRPVLLCLLVPLVPKDRK